MLQYDKIDVSDINKTIESKECIVCHYDAVYLAFPPHIFPTVFFLDHVRSWEYDELFQKYFSISNKVSNTIRKELKYDTLTRKTF